MTLLEKENALRAERKSLIIKRSLVIEKSIIEVIKADISDQNNPSDEDIEAFVYDEYRLDTELNRMLKGFGDQKLFYQPYIDIEADRVVKKMISKDFE